MPRKHEEIKLKEIKIEVKPFREDAEEVIEAFRKISEGKYVKEDKIVVESIEDLRKMLTRERLKLLHAIKMREPRSIYELAKIVDRERKAVSIDLNILEKLGLIEFERREYRKRLIVTPRVVCDRIEVAILV